MSQFDDDAWPAAAPKVPTPPPGIPVPDAAPGQVPGPGTLSLPLVVPPGPDAAPDRTGGRRRGPLAALAASAAAVVVAAGLVTAFLLHEGAGRCDPRPAAAARLHAAPVAAVRPLVAVAPPPISTTTWAAGTATYYGPATTGTACAAPTIPASRYTVALGPEEYAAGAACGTYLDLRGRRGTIRVEVTNLCPECRRGQLDLSDEAFAALDALPRGVTRISYRAVRDPRVGPLAVRVKDGSNPYWLALQVDQHGNALRSVEVAGASRGFRPAALQPWGYWLLDTGAGPGPFRVRVTDVHGHVATLTGIRLAPMRLQVTDVRLYGGPPASRATRSPAPGGSATSRATAPAPARTPRTATATPTPTTATPSAPATTAPPEPELTITPDAPAPATPAASADRC